MTSIHLEEAFHQDQPRGRWRCVLCGDKGPGGVTEYEAHYMRAHTRVVDGVSVRFPVDEEAS